MEKIFAETLADSTYSAVIAMIYAFSGVVVPQFTLLVETIVSIVSFQKCYFQGLEPWDR